MAAWQEIPPELAGCICDKLDCVVPRSSFASSSSAWRLASSSMPNATQVPWLLCPSTTPQGPDPVYTVCAHELVFCIKCSRNHRVHLPNVLPGSRFIGCPYREWISVARGQMYDNALVNARTGDSIPLPDLAIMDPAHEHCTILIRAAVLSDEPSAGAGCAVAVIGTVMFPITWAGHRFVAFSHIGDDIFTGAVSGDFEDISYHNGAFMIVDKYGRIFVTSPDPNVDWSHVAAISEPIMETTEHILLGRYLVSSGGQLMLFSRYSDCYGGATTALRAHVMVHSDQPNEFGDEFRFQEVTDLEGRSFFLGRGCSMAFDMDSVGGVYFVDDRSFGSGLLVYGGSSETHYPTSDNGRWSFETRTITRFPVHCQSSEYSSPIWIQHSGLIGG